VDTAASRCLVALGASEGFTPHIAFRSNSFATVRGFVAAGLGVRRSDVELLAGKTGRRKRLLVRNATPAAVDRWLADMNKVQQRMEALER